MGYLTKMLDKDWFGLPSATPSDLYWVLLAMAEQIEANTEEIDKLKTRLKASYSITRNQKTPPTIPQHTAGARAAEKIALRIWPEERGFTKKDSWISQKVAEFTAIIDSETGLPEIIAERDRLRGALREIVVKAKLHCAKGVNDDRQTSHHAALRSLDSRRESTG